MSVKHKHESEIARKKQRAHGFILDSPTPASGRSLVGWLNCETPLDSEEWVAAQVRDTQETVEVIALKRHGDGYTLFGEESDLSLEIVDPRAKSVLLAKHCASPGP